MHRRRALELRLVDVASQHRSRRAAEGAPQRVRVTEAAAEHSHARAATLRAKRRRRDARRQRSVVVEAAPARERPVEARELHAHPAAHAAATRRRQATQTRRPAAPATRGARLTEAALQAARPRAVSHHAHHRRAVDRAAPWLHVEHAHRHEAQTHAARRVLTSVVAHLETSLARRRPSRVAHDRARARPHRTTHRAADPAGQHAKRLRR